MLLPMDIRELPRWMEKDASLLGLLRIFKLKVPNALVLYTLLGMLDLGFSKMAFSVGVAEGNLFLEAALDYGLFEVNKLILTLTVLFLGIFLWKHRIVKQVMFVANVGMFLLVLVHVYGLTVYLMK